MMTLIIRISTLLVVLSAGVVAADAVSASTADAQRRSNGYIYISNVDVTPERAIDKIEELHPVTTPTKRMLITKYEVSLVSYRSYGLQFLLQIVAHN